jgi:hypothetical protein
MSYNYIKFEDIFVTDEVTFKREGYFIETTKSLYKLRVKVLVNLVIAASFYKGINSPTYSYLYSLAP